LVLGTGIAAAIAVLLAGGYGAYQYAHVRAPGTPTPLSPAKNAEETSPPPPTEPAGADASSPSGAPSQSDTTDPDLPRSAERDRGGAPAAEAPPKTKERKAEEGSSVEERAVAAETETKRTAIVAPVAKEPPPKPSVASFDGAWTFARSTTERCGSNGSVFSVVIAGGLVHGPGGKGSVSPSGQVKFPGKANYFTGTLSGSSGRGTYEGRCTGTFTARRK
jgi:hypothetical protein